MDSLNELYEILDEMMDSTSDCAQDYNDSYVYDSVPDFPNTNIVPSAPPTSPCGKKRKLESWEQVPKKAKNQKIEHKQIEQGTEPLSLKGTIDQKNITINVALSHVNGYIVRFSDLILFLGCSRYKTLRIEISGVLDLITDEMNFIVFLNATIIKCCENLEIEFKTIENSNKGLPEKVGVIFMMEEPGLMVIDALSLVSSRKHCSFSFLNRMGNKESVSKDKSQISRVSVKRLDANNFVPHRLEEHVLLDIQQVFFTVNSDNFWHFGSQIFEEFTDMCRFVVIWCTSPKKQEVMVKIGKAEYLKFVLGSECTMTVVGKKVILRNAIIDSPENDEVKDAILKLSLGTLQSLSVFEPNVQVKCFQEPERSGTFVNRIDYYFVKRRCERLETNQFSPLLISWEIQLPYVNLFVDEAIVKELKIHDGLGMLNFFRYQHVISLSKIKTNGACVLYPLPCPDEEEIYTLRFED